MKLLLLALVILVLAACGSTGSSDTHPDFEELSRADKWRGYNQEAVPASWKIVDGVIHLTESGGTDLITVERYASFDLVFEWKVSPKGNSGVMYRVTENDGPAYVTGPEYQVLDNAAMDRHNPLTAAGANYAMHGKDGDDTLPVGEWNAARILVDGAHVEHWLNGVLQCEYDFGSEAWEQRVRDSKWKDTPGYGRSPEGHIALQDHGNPVWYRNVAIRRL